MSTAKPRRTERFDAPGLAAFARRHISYEIGMAATVTQVLHQPPGLHGEALKNVLLESVLVHLRLLDDFVGRATRAHADDVLALDYLDTWDPVEGGPLGEFRRPINTQVAHLSIAREAGRLWNVLALTNSVLGECGRFFDSLEAHTSPFVEPFATAASSTSDFLEWAEEMLAEPGEVDPAAPGAFGQTLETSTSPVDVRVFRYVPPRYFGS